MKQIAILIALLAISVSANAQYNSSAALHKKGGRLYLGDEKLSKEQIQLTLSSFCNEDGVSYDELWNKASAMRTSGIVLTSAGSAATVAGPVLSVIGLAKVLGSGIGSALAGDPDGVVGEGELIAGLVLTGAGVAMLGSGIPLLCVGNKRMKTISLQAGPGNLGLTLRF